MLEAKRMLPHGLFEFIHRGVEDELALKRNVESFGNIMMMPKPLIDVGDRNADAEILGKKVPMPVVIAPTGIAGLCWYEGELELAKAAADFGVPFALATTSMTELGKICREVPHCRLWFQLYMYEDKRLSIELVDRAAQANCEALVLTVDQTAVPNREYMKRNGFSVPFKITREGFLDLILHYRWLIKVLARYLVTSGMPTNRNYPTDFQDSILKGPSKRVGMRNDRISWDDLGIIRERWPGTLFVKGILRSEDALRCLDMGADGIVVSNHGGRTFDSAPAPISILPKIVADIQGRGQVIVDSGIRRGSDIAKALALGADSVMVGRATLYGVSAAGASGAELALRLLHNELLGCLASLGCRSLKELSPEMIVG